MYMQALGLVRGVALMVGTAGILWAGPTAGQNPYPEATRRNSSRYPLGLEVSEYHYDNLLILAASDPEQVESELASFGKVEIWEPR